MDNEITDESIDISKDLLWKVMIEELSFEFMDYFLPEWAENNVDRNKPCEFLDTELANIQDKIVLGLKRADKLIKVFLKDGTEKFIYFHVEVQGYKDDNFSERMFITFYRLYEKYSPQKIMAFALYSDENKNYKPSEFVYEYETVELVYRFATFKILHKSLDELYVKDNIFSFVMLAVRRALDRKSQKDTAQLKWKTDLIKDLVEAGYSDKKIDHVLYFIYYYIGIKDNTITQKLDSNIATITKQQKNMSIPEIVRNAYIEAAEIKGEARGEAKTKDKMILRCFSKGMKISEISDLVDMPTEYIKELVGKK